MQQHELLKRRAFLMGGAAMASALRAMPDTPACTLTAEQEEGPYYLDYEKVRSDITEGKSGVPLRLRIALMHAKRCAPLSNASLDIWHCDATGIYSGFTANHPTGPGGPGGRGGFPPGPPPSGDFGPPPRRHGALDATRFLRGLQTTDRSGIAEFATIYPGWYLGRAIHIHLKVHAGGHVAHTGQLFFPEEITERIAQLQPYAKHREVHRTTQDEDEIFESQHGAGGMLTLNRVDAKSDTGGFVATVTLAVDPDAIPEPVRMRGFGGRR
jgi:protocatechuate 3,4-dioxygenase beta subunit